MLLEEIHHNIAVVQTLEHWRGAVLTIDVRLLPRMKAEVWHDVRVRATQLLPEELTTTLNDYYSPLDNVIAIRKVQEDPEKLDLSNHVIMDALKKQAERQYRAPPILYVDYALLTLQAQNIARNQVADYLALPWWERVPVTGWVVRQFAIRSRRPAV